MAFEHELQQLGLSEKEANVYLALLEMGSSTVQEIAQKAGIPRPTAHLATESLIQKGLATSHERGKKRYVGAESPARLLELARKKEEAFHEEKNTLARILPDLEKLFAYAGERPRVRFFEGKEGMLALYEEFLRAKENEIVSIADVDGFTKTFTPAEITEYRKKLAGQQIRVREIFTSSAGSSHATAPHTEVAFLARDAFPIEGDMAAYGNKLVLGVWSPRPMGVLIESQQLVNTFRAVFELLWGATHKNNRSS